MEISRWLAKYNALSKESDNLYRGLVRELGGSECALWILYTLRAEKPPVTQKTICDILHAPKQTVNSAMRRLEADGCKLAWLRDAATPGFFLELSEGNVVRGNNHIAFITDERDKWYLQHQRERLIDREIRELGIYFMHDMDGKTGG